MGAGASMGNDQVLGGAHGSGDARRYFCHQCHQITRSRSLAAECGACGSAFVELMEGGVASGDSSLDYSRMLSGRDVNGVEGSRRDMNLSEDQSRRLANAAIMLRLLERQLQSELESIQETYRRVQADQEATQCMSPIMKRKLRRPKTDVNMICSQPSCPICSEDFVVESEVTCLPCSHIYHEDCVVPWLDLKKTCPICRYELTNDLPSVTDLEKHTREELISMLEEETKELAKEESNRLGKAASDDKSDSAETEAETDKTEEKAADSVDDDGKEFFNKAKVAKEIIEIMQRRKAASEKEKGALDSNRLRELRERQNRPRAGFRTAQERAANPSPSNRTLREVIEEGERESARQTELRRERMRQLGILPAAESTGSGHSGDMYGGTSGTLPLIRGPTTVEPSVASHDDFSRVLAAIIQSSNMGIAMDSESDDDAPTEERRTGIDSRNVSSSIDVTEARTNLENARSALADAREENSRLEAMRVGSSLSSMSGISAPNTFVIRSNGGESMQIERRQALREAIDNID